MATRRWTRVLTILLVLLALPLSAAAQEADETVVVALRDISYAEREGTPLLLDAYFDPVASGRPVLILVHGGSWRSRSKQAWEVLGPEFAKAGYTALAINYSLAPPGGGVRFPTPVDDLSLALGWAREHAGDYGGDPGRIAMVGSSAGGHLSLLSGNRAGDRPEAIVAYSPPVTLHRLYRREILPGAITNFIGCSPDICPANYLAASARSEVDPATPPTYLAFSWNELIPSAQGRMQAKTLNNHGVPNELTVFSGRSHGIRLAKKAFYDTLAFLTAQL